MEMHAYSEDYLLTAQRILGDMLDYAVNEYEFDPDEFYKMFLVSDVSLSLIHICGICHLTGSLLRKGRLQLRKETRN